VIKTKAKNIQQKQKQKQKQKYNKYREMPQKSKRWTYRNSVGSRISFIFFQFQINELPLFESRTQIKNIYIYIMLQFLSQWKKK